MNAVTLGAALAVLSAFGFSTLAIWGKLAPQVGLSDQTFLLARFAFGALVLLPFAARGLNARARLAQIGFGLVYTVQTTLYFAALGQTSAGVTTLLLYLAPAFVVLYEWLLGVRPTAAQLGGLALSSLGLITIVGVPSDGTVTGLLLAVLSGACYAGFLVASGRLFNGADSLTLTAHASVGSAVGFLVLGTALGSLRLPSSLSAWGVILGAGVLATVMAIPLMFAAVQRLGATRASLLFTLEPVFVAALALVFLGEGLTPAKLIGGALILAGALLAQLRGTAPTSAPSAQS